jgi:hypothetical protein
LKECKKYRNKQDKQIKIFKRNKKT